MSEIDKEVQTESEKEQIIEIAKPRQESEIVLNSQNIKPHTAEASQPGNKRSHIRR